MRDGKPVGRKSEGEEKKKTNRRAGEREMIFLIAIFFNERERGEKSKTVYVLISLKRGVKKYGENFY